MMESNKSESRGREATREPIEGSTKEDYNPFEAGGKLDCTHLIKNNPDLLGGKVLRWVNNEGGRIQQKLSQGWEVVNVPNHSVAGIWSPSKKDETKKAKTESTVVTIPVGRGKTIEAMDAVLMCKPKEDFASQDRAHIHKKTAATMAAIDGGEVAGSAREAGIQTYNTNSSKIRTGL